MTAQHADQIIDGYLARLESELARVPNARRRELLDDVRTHISEARAALTDETDADLLNILERLGESAALALEEGAQEAPRRPPFRANALEAIALLAVALFPFVGIPLLWLSQEWTRRDKAMVSLVIAGFWLGAFAGLPFGLGHWFLAVQVLGAIFLAFRLPRRAPRLP